MLLISILTGLIVMLVFLALMELVCGIDKSKKRLKKHLLTLNGVHIQEKRFQRSIGILNRYSALLKASSVPALLLLVFIVGIVLLKNVYIFIFLCLAGMMFFLDLKRSASKKKKEKLSYYMRDFMISITNSLRSGASLQNAIERSVGDLKRLPVKKADNPLLEEIEKIVLDIHMGRSIDEALFAFRKRVNIEEADIFVNMTLKLRETGGDITEILTMVSGMISERIMFKRDIMTLTAGKRYEAGILTVVPIALLILLSITAPSYIAPMFETSLGRIMTLVGFLLILTNYYIGQRIVDINI